MFVRIKKYFPSISTNKSKAREKDLIEVFEPFLEQV